jgi:hypothetical protein
MFISRNPTPCPKGTYMPYQGNTQCYQCSFGTQYASQVNSTSCQQCPSNCCCDDPTQNPVCLSYTSSTSSGTTQFSPCNPFKSCKNGGTCFGNGNSYTCVCPPNTSGLSCEVLINYCPGMWPQCTCPFSYLINCINFTQWNQIDFTRLIPSSLNFQQSSTIEISFTPSRLLIFNSNLNASGLEIFQLTGTNFHVYVANVIGFDIKSNPFYPYSNASSNLYVSNSTLDFYVNGVPFNQSQCSASFFSGVHYNANNMQIINLKSI